MTRRAANLFGCKAKLGWARRHLDSLRRDVGAFFSEHPCTARVEPDREGDGLVVRMEHVPRIPALEWGLVVGDCVHTLRSALDSIAWELAGADPFDTRTAFPIFMTAEEYEDRAPRRLARLSPQARAAIDKVQPFHTADPAGHPLWILDRLHTAGRHRLLSSVAVMPDTAALTLPIAAAVDAHLEAFGVRPAAGWPLDTGATVARLRPGSELLQVNMKVAVRPEIAFGEQFGRDRRMVVVDTLQRIIEDVAGVGVSFKEHFALDDQCAPAVLPEP